jgi:hypothetical protein
MDVPTFPVHRAASAAEPGKATSNNTETKVDTPIFIFDEDVREIVLEPGNHASQETSARQQAAPRVRAHTQEELAQKKAFARKQKLFPTVSQNFLQSMPSMGHGRQALERSINNLTTEQKLQLGAALRATDSAERMPPPARQAKRKPTTNLNSRREHRQFHDATASPAAKQPTTAAGEKAGRVTAAHKFSPSFRHDVLDVRHDCVSVGNSWAGTRKCATDDQVDAIGFEIEQGIEKDASPATLVPIAESFFTSALSCGANAAQIIPGITEKLVLHFKDEDLEAAYQVVAAAIKTLAAIKSSLGERADIAIDLFDPEDGPDENFLLLLENYVGAGNMPGHDRDALRYIDLQKRIGDCKNTD